MKKLSIVIPMYYEEEVAEECYNRMTKVCNSIQNYEYEIIFVNDGSQDKTLSILETIAKKDKNVKIISFSRNFGHQCAVTAGLKYVTGDAIVIIDADLQDPPELIPEMLKLWEQGNEVIYGKRKKRDGESKFKLLTASMLPSTVISTSFASPQTYRHILSKYPPSYGTQIHSVLSIFSPVALSVILTFVRFILPITSDIVSGRLTAVVMSFFEFTSVFIITAFL